MTLQLWNPECLWIFNCVLKYANPDCKYSFKIGKVHKTDVCIFTHVCCCSLMPFGWENHVYVCFRYATVTSIWEKQKGEQQWNCEQGLLHSLNSYCCKSQHFISQSSTVWETFTKNSFLTVVPVREVKADKVNVVDTLWKELESCGDDETGH